MRWMMKTPESVIACAVMTWRSEEHTSELQSPCNLVCRLLLEKKKNYRMECWVGHPVVESCPQTSGRWERGTMPWCASASRRDPVSCFANSFTRSTRPHGTSPD